nr:MAG TPA: hypothetical protein [Caudoviricetes sp.]
MILLSYYIKEYFTIRNISSYLKITLTIITVPLFFYLL